MAITVGLTDAGCIIDESHGSAVDLDCRIIRYAELVAGYRPSIAVDAMRNAGQWEPIHWEADAAVDYLNEHATDGNVVFVVEDNSLFIWPIDDEMEG